MRSEVSSNKKIWFSIPSGFDNQIYTPSPETFGLVSDAYSRQLKNLTFQRTPYEQALELLSRVAVFPHFAQADKLEEMEKGVLIIDTIEAGKGETACLPGA